ncbi:MAG TPA: dihydrofolate reductase, partial [Balneolaceae bacterium]|nr:dihydrofolate reductase [Balneolaceae bacterium]
MTITLVAAHDPNLVIGKDGGLPWRYPEDLKHFKRTTIDGTIIMGRGVFEELNEIPLPGRKNIVLSTTQTYPNVETHTSLEEALKSS